jgi:hypothetical protein
LKRIEEIEAREAMTCIELSPRKDDIAYLLSCIRILRGGLEEINRWFDFIKRITPEDKMYYLNPDLAEHYSKRINDILRKLDNDDEDRRN